MVQASLVIVLVVDIKSYIIFLDNIVGADTVVSTE